jgi:uncharacterized protein (DUF1800 family)
VKWTRREILAATAIAGAMGGCEKIISRVTEHLGQDVPESFAVPDGSEIDPAHHLLSRAAFGPRPGDIDRVRAVGRDQWIEEQLNPDSIDDKLCDLRARRFEELEQQAGESYEYDQRVLRQDLARHTLLRAVYSKRQLFEVMVGFWTDHLNINIGKGDCIYLKGTDDREVIRKHALGKFRDLIRASATSPAMLIYLDGDQNAAGVPNENYGRELMELHTLGVDGGYSQHDVFEAARALTGWRVRKKFRRGSVYFDRTRHDAGEKRLLGQSIPAKLGEKEVDRVVDIVCGHPATARHIATKLARRFVSDAPLPGLVDRLARVFGETDGDIKTVMRTVLASEEFGASRGNRFKPPFRFVVSALRAIGADTHAHPPLIEYLMRMGQGVFEYPTPDGYPDKTEPWLGTLLWRWNFAFALSTGQVPTVSVPMERLQHVLKQSSQAMEERIFEYFAGRAPASEEGQSLRDGCAGLTDAEQVALVMASPQFQWY